MSRSESPPPPPMTDEDVHAVMVRLSALNADEINEICDVYAQKLKALLVVCRKSINTEDEDDIVEIERLIRLLNLCPKEELFIRSKDKIWHARYHILNRNADWFLKRNYAENIKKDAKKRMIETLIKFIQGHWARLSDEEREIYWGKALEMLHIVAKYKKLTKE